MSLSIRSNVAKVSREIMALARQVADMGPVARSFGAHMVRASVRRMARTAKWQPSSPGSAPARQSGELGNSLSWRERSGGDVVEWGSHLAYARIQDEGGTIRPRRARALTIPIDDRARGKRAKDFAGLFMIPIDSGDPDTVGLLAIPGTSDDDFQPLFVLRTRVDMPARPYLYIDDDDEAELHSILERHLSRS